MFFYKVYNYFEDGFFVYWSAAGKKILARRRRKKIWGKNKPKLEKHLRTLALPQFGPFFPHFALKRPRKKKHWSGDNWISVSIFVRKIKILVAL